MAYIYKTEAGFFRAARNGKFSWKGTILYTRYKLPLSFLVEFQKKLNWQRVYMHQLLPEHFLREKMPGLIRGRYKNSRVMLQIISSRQELSEAFIRDYWDYLDGNYICFGQQLSENFMREKADKLNWLYISQYQKMSPEFIDEMRDRIFWGPLSINDKVEKIFIDTLNEKESMLGNLKNSRPEAWERLIAKTELGLFL
jgi:hypothetical protein